MQIMEFHIMQIFFSRAFTETNQDFARGRETQENKTGAYHPPAP
jgi:hypothetical protein